MLYTIIWIDTPRIILFIDKVWGIPTSLCIPFILTNGQQNTGAVYSANYNGC